MGHKNDYPWLLLQTVYTQLTPDIKERFRELGREKGMNMSDYLRILIYNEIDEVEFEMR